MADWNCSYGERSSTCWQGGEKPSVHLMCMWWLSRQSAHVAQKCAQGLKPKQVGNEHVLICLYVYVFVTWAWLVRLMPIIVLVWLWSLCLEIGRNRCVYGVCLGEGTNRQSHMLSVCLSARLSWLSADLFFYFLFPSVTRLSNSPPVRPVLIYALLCVITVYLFVQSWSKRKKQLSSLVLGTYSKK